MVKLLDELRINSIAGVGSSIPSQMLVDFLQSQTNSVLGMIRATQNNVFNHNKDIMIIYQRRVKNSTFVWSMPMCQELFAASQQTNVRTDVSKLFDIIIVFRIRIVKIVIQR